MATVTDTDNRERAGGEPFRPPETHTQRVLDTRDADLAETTVLDVRKIRRLIGAPRRHRPGLQSMIAEAAADLRRRRLVYAGVFAAAAAVGAAIAQALA